MFEADPTIDLECPEGCTEIVVKNKALGNFGEETCPDCGTRFRWEVVPAFLSTEIKKN